MPFRSRRGNFVRSVTENVGKVDGGAEESQIVSVANYTVLGVQLVEDGGPDWDGKVKFEASNDGENWEDLEMMASDNSTDLRSVTDTVGDEGFWLTDVAGIKYVRISSTADGDNGHVEIIVTKE